MIDFSKRVKDQTHEKKINPIDIYDALDRTSSTGPLRPAQARILDAWYNTRRQDKDLIVKLHTGAGKTLIGLLVAYSYLNGGEGPSIYVCPNIYLMQQVCAEAAKFGIPFCYIDSDTNEIPDDFVQGRAVLITYVQKVFNGLSIFGIGNRSMPVGCLILDDSHACIDSISSACTITLANDTEAYQLILKTCENDLKLQGEGTYQDFLNGDRDVVLPIPYWTWQNNISQFTSIIASSKEYNGVKFAWPLLKDCLVDCCSYISKDKIEITPPCLPVQQFGIFNQAKHRVLMSATTQEDTLFIKGLGLSIDSVATPLVDEEYHWSGEKMILLPELLCDAKNADLIISTVSNGSPRFGTAILVPSFEKAHKYQNYGAQLINKPGQRFQMYKELAEFKKNFAGRAIILANRYDGIDLPDDTCRVLVMDSVPYYDSLSDRYEEICRSQSAIVQIKTIQKIEQGLGRSVRGEKDYSVILIFGRDLIKLLRSVNSRRLFSKQTQKQIEIGFEIIDMAKESPELSPEKEYQLLFDTIDQCLRRDEGWKAYYADKMNGIADDHTNKISLYGVLQNERDAYTATLSNNYEKACEIVQSIVDSCTDIAEKGWYLQIKAKYQNRISKSSANALQISAFKFNNQLLKPISGISYNRIKYEINDSRIKRAQKYIERFENYSEFSLEIEDALSCLAFGVIAEKFENAFCTIGKFLGFLSQRPDKEIRKGPDNLWCVGDNRYVLIECKSEVLTTRKSISKTEAGQMEEHCAWFEQEYGNAEVINVLAIPTVDLATDAYFSHDVKIMTASNLNRLVEAIRALMLEFKQYDLKSLTTETINSLLITHNMHDEFFIRNYLDNPKNLH